MESPSTTNGYTYNELREFSYQVRDREQQVLEVAGAHGILTQEFTHAFAKLAAARVRAALNLREQQECSQKCQRGITTQGCPNHDRTVA